VAVIVVIGEVIGRQSGQDGIEPAGATAAVAMAAVAAGGTVEIVTRIGDDAAGDAVVLGLAKSGVRHVATIRDAGRRTPVIPETADGEDPIIDATPVDATPDGAAAAPSLDAAGVGLALRYLDDYRVIVLLHPADPAIIREASEAAGWASAELVVVTPDVPEDIPEIPAGALAVAADRHAESVATLLGRYAAAVDRGDDAAAAYAEFRSALSD
jgi:hypothetical protein